MGDGHDFTILGYRVHWWKPGARTRFGTHSIDGEMRVVSLGWLMVRYWKAAA